MLMRPRGQSFRQQILMPQGLKCGTAFEREGFFRACYPCSTSQKQTATEFLILGRIATLSQTKSIKVNMKTNLLAVLLLLALIASRCGTGL